MAEHGVTQAGSALECDVPFDRDCLRSIARSTRPQNGTSSRPALRSGAVSSGDRRTWQPFELTSGDQPGIGTLISSFFWAGIRPEIGVGGGVQGAGRQQGDGYEGGWRGP